MKEIQLAKILVDYYENKGYECYKEVSSSGSGGSKRADCYFIKKENGEIIDSFSVETKMTLGLNVIEQAYKWKPQAKRVYVGVPRLKRKPVKARKFAMFVCNKLGIGIIEIAKGDIKIIQEVEDNLKYKMPPLYEEQKKSKAGNAKSQFFTKYKKTIANIDKFMKDKKEYSLKDLLNQIEHHYSNNLSAHGCIIKYIKKGIIKNYTTKRGNKCIMLVKIK